MYHTRRKEMLGDTRHRLGVISKYILIKLALCILFSIAFFFFSLLYVYIAFNCKIMPLYSVYIVSLLCTYLKGLAFYYTSYSASWSFCCVMPDVSVCN